MLSLSLSLSVGRLSIVSEQTVEEVKSSLGVKTKDMEDIRERLRKQGLHSTKVDVRGGVEDDCEGGRGGDQVGRVRGSARRRSSPPVVA